MSTVASTNSLSADNRNDTEQTRDTSVTDGGLATTLQTSTMASGVDEANTQPSQEAANMSTVSTEGSISPSSSLLSSTVVSSSTSVGMTSSSTNFSSLPVYEDGSLTSTETPNNGTVINFTSSSPGPSSVTPHASPSSSSFSPSFTDTEASGVPTFTMRTVEKGTTSCHFSNHTEVNKITSGDCSRAIGITVGLAVVIWILTVVIFVILLLRMKRAWQQKLREERQRTDIWSLSTFHNTIINDNFLDYQLAPKVPSRKNRGAVAGNTQTAQLKSSRLSSGALSRTSSIYNDDYTFRQSIIRRSTLSDDERFRFARSKTRAKRQPSNYSSDSWLGPNSDFRVRTSTFNTGKQNLHDKHRLVNHDELRISGSRSFDGIEMLENHSAEPKSQSQDQPYYVTEL